MEGDETSGQVKHEMYTSNLIASATAHNDDTFEESIDTATDPHVRKYHEFVVRVPEKYKPSGQEDSLFDSDSDDHDGTDNSDFES